MAATAVIGKKLACQPPTAFARFSHVVDVSVSMGPINSELESSVLKSFYDWTSEIFDDGNAHGIVKFSDKKVFSGAQDVCGAVEAPLAFADPTAAFAAMEKGIAQGLQRTVLDGMYVAAKQDWDTPLDKGRQFQIVYTDRLPRFIFPEMPDFSVGCDCEVCASPSVEQVASVFSEVYQNVMFVVPVQYYEAYIEYSEAAKLNFVVLPLTSDGNLLELMQAGLNSLICGTAPPTVLPNTTDDNVVVTGETILIPPCTEDAFLQLLHLQDMSHSYTNDLGNMRAKFPELLTLLKEKFYKRNVALGSFVDKPVGDSGYAPYDYCYREEINFTEDPAAFTSAFDELEIKSGRDWKESQYDAVWDGIRSSNLGWEDRAIVDGRRVLKVVMVATDAGPHVRGDLPSLPPTGSDCKTRDYPDPTELGAELDAKKVYPIFVVTSDIYNHWTRLLQQVTPNARVVHLSQPAEDVFAAIVDALEDICIDASKA